MPTIWFNGQFIDKGSLNIQTSNRSFLYGDGFFETVRLNKYKAVFFNRHYVRFIEAMTYLQMEIPEHWSVVFLQKTLEELARKNNLPNARIRMTVWRGGEGRYTPQSHYSELLIEAFSLENDFYKLNTKGLKSGWFEGSRRWADEGTFYKSANAKIYTLAGMYAQSQGWDDIVIMNQYNRLADALHSNVFIWLNNQWITPPISEGCIDGVVRKVLIRQMIKWNMPLEIRPIERNDFSQCEEVMLTNSIEGIQWVGLLEGKEYNNKISSMVLGKLNELLPISI